MAQATWVTLCMMPVLALNSIPRTTLAALPVLGLTDVVGILLYVGGISFEITADRQKSAWVEAKRNKEHDEDFLTHGLWSKSRHPNYFGESTLWTGIATTAAGVLLSKTGQKGMPSFSALLSIISSAVKSTLHYFSAPVAFSERKIAMLTGLQVWVLPELTMEECLDLECAL